MQKNRLAQSGPWRKNIGGGVVVQEALSYREADPNEANVSSLPLEVSSGAALGGVDMRPGFTPLLKTSRLEVELDATLVNEGDLGQPVNVTLELSDDAGVSWVIIGESDPLTSWPGNAYGAGPTANSQRFDVQYRAAAALLTAFPDYAGGEIIGRATIMIDNTSNTVLVSEANPGNCRVALREIVA